MKNKKKFITFEGGEGSGKSTQAKLLYSSIKKISNEKVFLTREPGGTKLSEKIRKLIVSKTNYQIDPITELLLINASRNEHIKKVILPKLLNNYTIISDRFLDSTFAYQVSGHGLNEKIFDNFNNFIIDGCLPYITFLIDISPTVGIERSLKIKKIENRFENFNINFHKRVRNGFKTIAKNNKRIHLINGHKSIKNIHAEIVNKLNDATIFKEKLNIL